MISVGIPILSGSGWLGGINYFKALAHALNTVKSQDVHVTYLTNDSSFFDSFASDFVSICEEKSFYSRNFFWRVANRLVSTNIPLARNVNKNKFDIVTHFRIGRFSGVPEVLWVPDFQHKYYPELFTDEEISHRDRMIYRSREEGVIFFSSYSAEADFRKFYPRLGFVKSHVLHFAPFLEMKDADTYFVRDKFNIESDFFYLPNQFWKHKNHKLVLEALATLPDNYVVVCTGKMEDYRGNKHISDLVEMVSDLSLGRRFIMLGMVSREDVNALLDQCLAVINPSLFEGWSTTVEEAKYSGKRLVLSDIPVHREQNPEDSLFFSPANPNELAGCMKIIFEEYDPTREQSRRIKSKAQYPSAIVNFANNYIRIVKSCVEEISNE